MYKLRIHDSVALFSWAYLDGCKDGSGGVLGRLWRSAKMDLAECKDGSGGVRGRIWRGARTAFGGCEDSSRRLRAAARIYVAARPQRCDRPPASVRASALFLIFIYGDMQRVHVAMRELTWQRSVYAKFLTGMFGFSRNCSYLCSRNILLYGYFRIFQ